MMRLHRSLVRDESGQAFVETAIFLPVMLMALMAVILFARLGVLSERTESAVRYGDLVSFRNGAAYSTSSIGYLLSQAVSGNTSTQLLDLCLAPASNSATPDPGSGVNADVRAALTQQQAVTSTATAAPAPAPFFRPDSVSQPNCNPGTIDLNGKSNSVQQPTPGQYAAGNLPLAVDGFSITASVGMNNYIANIFAGNGCTLSSGSACSSTTGSMAFVNVAAPTTLLECVAGLNTVLTIMNPSAKAPPCGS